MRYSLYLVIVAGFLVILSGCGPEGDKDAYKDQDRPKPVEGE